MRLICPNCAAQYEVDAAMIPEHGRDVQCSSCGHTWFQRRARAEDDWAEADAPGDPLAPAPDALPEPGPALTSEDEEEDDAPAPPPPPRRRMDEAAMAILREEAAREAAARRRELGGALETQGDLGLDADTPPRRRPPSWHALQPPEAEPEDVPEAEAVPEAESERPEPDLSGPTPDAAEAASEAEDESLFDASRAEEAPSPADDELATGEQDFAPDEEEPVAQGGRGSPAEEQPVAGEDEVPPADAEPIPEEDIAPGDEWSDWWDAGHDREPQVPAAATEEQQSEPDGAEPVTPALAPPPDLPEEHQAPAPAEEALHDRNGKSEVTSPPDIDVEQDAAPGHEEATAHVIPEVAPSRVAASSTARARPASEAAQSSRRELLPDIEEINSSLTASSRHDPAERPEINEDAGEKRSGFRAGFLSVVTLAAILLLAYGFAPLIVQTVPASEGVMIAYVEAANDVRDGIDGLLREASMALGNLVD